MGLQRTGNVSLLGLPTLMTAFEVLHWINVISETKLCQQ